MREIARLLVPVLWLSSASAVAQDAGVVAPDSVLLRAGQLVDVKAGKLLADQGILVSGETHDARRVTSRSAPCDAAPAMSESEWFALNRASWNGRTPVHLRSRSCDLEAFRAGQSSLEPGARAP
ncbi:MAG TPA: hypothetical protein VFI53_08210 [Myxococcaceae bacterium]|nr:hypothetical protein [Myxococcaceae bacterium]